MPDKILFVDDDANILAGIRRQLIVEAGYDIDTAESGDAGLAMIAANGPYAVVVSDMQMPNMNGAVFLSRLQDRSPDTVRILLTGYASIDTAIAAVNEGNIFRFLTKPVEIQVLVKALEAGIQMHRLVTAERVLLQQTLSGSIKVLTDVLALVNPIAFSRASKLRQHIKHMAAKLGIVNSWQFELAAILSQLGCVVIQQDILEKVYTGTRLSEQEQEKFSKHPSIACDLLANIPRMESVAQIIANQQVPYRELMASRERSINDPVILGAQMLNVALFIEQRISAGLTYEGATAELQKRSADYSPVVAGTLVDLQAVQSRFLIRNVKTVDLKLGMIMNQDIRSKKGMLLISNGQEITQAVINLIDGWIERGEIASMVNVKIPNNA